MKFFWMNAVTAFRYRCSFMYMAVCDINYVSSMNHPPGRKKVARWEKCGPQIFGLAIAHE